jgi:hypothetical protein
MRNVLNEEKKQQVLELEGSAGRFGASTSRPECAVKQQEPA